MSDIPKARDALIEAIALHKRAARLLSAALANMTREKAVRKAPRSSKKMDAWIAGKIRATAKANPKMSMQKIAELHGVQLGRVSEVLNRKGRWK